MLNSLLVHSPLLYFIQSFWRDEAFSVLAARQSIGFIVTRLGFEPPVYYTLLHVWMRVFGEGEIAARTLSVLAYLLTTAVMIEWAHSLYKKHWLSWYLPLFFFLNPMTLYYAFEVRTYAWYMLFATVMFYAYTRSRWGWFAAAALLGFYTHVFLLPYIGVLGFHYLITHRSLFSGRNFLIGIKRAAQDTGLRAFTAVGILIVPWLLKVASEAHRMRSSWYFPVDFRLVRSVLGNMFLGYEGTPWYGWQFTFYLSLMLIGLGVLSLTLKRQRKDALLFIAFAVLPMAAVVGISFVKPLFVNRYLIPTTVGEILIVAAAIAAIRRPLLQKSAAALSIAGVFWFNWWYPPLHAKPPIRDTFAQINSLMKEQDVVMANNPLIYLETLYYAGDRSRVYLYNPKNSPFPWYIGDALITPSRMARDFPVYPARAFLVNADGSFEVTYRMPL